MTTDDPRSQTIKLRLSGAEANLLRGRSKREGLAISSFLRRLFLDETRKAEQPTSMHLEGIAGFLVDRFMDDLRPKVEALVERELAKLTARKGSTAASTPAAPAQASATAKKPAKKTSKSKAKKPAARKAAPKAAAAPAKPTAKKKRAAPTNLDDLEQKVLACFRVGEPMKRAEIIATLKLGHRDAVRVTNVLGRLKARGTIKMTGERALSSYELAMTPPPPPPASSLPPAREPETTPPSASMSGVNGVATPALA